MNVDKIFIRTIQPGDNIALAAIVRSSLAEFGANKPGTVYYDDTTDHLYELFQTPRSIYYVALSSPNVALIGSNDSFSGSLIGGAGIFPSPGLPEDTCELVKMYLAPKARGLGLGRQLIDKSLEFAKEAGYKHVYLETMPELRKAVTVYEKFGFRYLKGPLGNTGHFGCDVWMLKDL